MDTNRLRYFCVVARTGSLQKASELLGLSPAALSKAMKILEGEVGFPLFVPSGRGIAITDRGRSAAEKAAPLLAQLEGLAADLQNPKSSAVRVGSFEVFTTHAVGTIVKAFEDAGLILRELVPGKLEAAIAEGVVDIGITYLPIPHPELDFLKVATVKMEVFALAPNLPFVVPAVPLEGTPTKVMGLDGWPDHLVGRPIKYHVALMESALELCRQGVASAFLPAFVVEIHNEKVEPRYRLKTQPRPDLPEAVLAAAGLSREAKATAGGSDV